MPGAPRYDPATTPLLDSRASGRCPVRVGLDHDPRAGDRRLAPSEAEEQRAAEGIEHERAVVATLAQIHPDLVEVCDPSAAEAMAATLRAMGAGRPLIAGGVLPDDLAGRRSGRPDLLVRTDHGGDRPTYAPVDIKNHRFARPKVPRPGHAGRDAREAAWRPPRRTLLDSASLRPSDAEPIADQRFSTDRLKTDGLQLAHYRRMLERTGFASPEPDAGIVDRFGELWWVDLAEPRWRLWWADDLVSTLEWEEHEHSFRLDVVTHTLHPEVDPQRGRLAVPVWTNECRSCPWRAVCRAELEDEDHVSLLPRSNWPRFVELRRRGATTRAALAACDPDEPGAPSWFGDLVDQARAATTGRPHRARGIDAIDVPDTDVEIDLDMEDTPAGVYLWGALTTLGPRARAADMGLEEGYRPFACWDEMTPEREAQLVDELFAWLDLAHARAAEHGLSISVCVWTAAEETRLRTIAGRGVGRTSPDEVALLVGGPSWCDLYALTKRQVVTGGSLSLKAVAPLAGFSWRDEDPGGEQSTIWYRHALDAAIAGDEDAAERHRRRILTYNEDDVRATRAVRQWLRAEGPTFPAL